VARADLESIVTMLTFAASQVIPAPDRKPWRYGWSSDEYRHSDAAALSGAQGPVTLTGEGIASWEKAAEELLRHQQIKDRWDAEQFWGLLASFVVTASETEDPTKFLATNVALLRTIGRTLNLELIANVAWNRPPVDFGDIIIGDSDSEFLEFVNKRAGKRSSIEAEAGQNWLEGQVQPRVNEEDATRPVAMACWTVGQMVLAHRETERQLRNLVDLTILLERDLKGHKIYRRGATNRPGIRGLTLDRGAIERGLSGSARLELASMPFQFSAISHGRSGASWYGVEPLPLGKLMEQEYLHQAVTSCLKKNPIASRIQVAARWFAEAHYTSADDDAALALGVSMDAMLSGQRALPGNAMADRFALLSDNPSERPGLVKAYLEFYSVRSSIAHGGRSSKLDRDNFIADYQASVHWGAWRLLALRDIFTPDSENEIDSLFDDLRWGVRNWP
jgi:Apea-like HEPN